MAVYFVRDVGMGPLELVLVGTALEVGYFLFEVPTGVVADTYSRRASVILAQLITGASVVVIGLVPSFVVIAIASAVQGFGWTFMSGADDAWLADEIGTENVARVYQHSAQLSRAAGLVGIALSVALGSVDLRIPVVAAGATTIGVGLFLAVGMPERGFRPAPRDRIGAAASMAATAQRGGRLLLARPVLLLIVGITACGGAWSEAFDRLGQAHLLVDVGVPALGELDPLVWFGILNAGTLLLALTIARPLSGRLSRAGRETMARALLVLDAVMIGGTLAFALAGRFAPAIAAFWTITVARSLAAPVYSAWVNVNVDDSSVRATVISMTNLGDSVGQWAGGPVLGAIGSAAGMPAALGVGAAVLSPALWLYTRAIRHHGREPELAEPAAAAVAP
jgi:DHA3 family tetracycline resistance protein-like MFS transporter